MITFQTPLTGYPDLEAKIAYGLARIGTEAIGLEKVVIKNCGGYYQVRIDIDDSDFQLLENTFDLLCRRLLSDEHIPSMTPGITGRSARRIKTTEKDAFPLKEYLGCEYAFSNKKTENVCKHSGSSLGNVMGFAASTAYYNKRNGIDIVSIPQDTRNRNSPKLLRRPTNPRNICKTCGLLSLLGSWYSTFMFSMVDKQVIGIPIPNREVSGDVLGQVFAYHHLFRKEWFGNPIPEKAIPLVILARIPSTAYFLKDFDLLVIVFSGGGNRGYHADAMSITPIKNYVDFIDASSFNIATIERLINTGSYELLRILNELVFYGRKELLGRFARIYVSQDNTKSSNYRTLLYVQTAYYFLREVAMINPEIIENPAIGSLSRTLRYFVMNKKYGYADDIRNARKESRDFEDTIAKMLREGRLRLEQNEKIHLPSENEIKEIFRLAYDRFEEVKTALTILAFSFPSGIEQN